MNVLFNIGDLMHPSFHPSRTQVLRSELPISEAQRLELHKPLTMGRRQVFLTFVETKGGSIIAYQLNGIRYLLTCLCLSLPLAVFPGTGRRCVHVELVNGHTKPKRRDSIALTQEPQRITCHSLKATGGSQTKLYSSASASTR